MTDWNNVFYFSVTTAALLLSLLALWFTIVMPGIGRWNRRFFLAYFLVILACCMTVLLETAFLLYRFPRTAIYIILLAESLLLSVPLPMLTVYLLHSAAEALRGNRLLRAVLVFWGLYAALLPSAPFTGVIDFIAGESRYLRGPLYFLVMVPLIIILLLNLAGAFRRRSRLSRKIFLGFLVALLPMIASLTANMFFDALPLFDVSFVTSAMVMYSFVLSDQIAQDLRHQQEIARQQQEIAQQKASIMVLQMRPHFIYNTMTSIYCLCQQDPDLAQKLTLNFTTYLRRNLNAIASAEPIPFSMELEHTRAYLAVEEAQYEDSLSVVYDTPHVMFRLPPLTLQPLVENAVKHGRDPWTGPLHITIRTRKTDTGSEIVIADDGRGFQEEGDNGTPDAASRSGSAGRDDGENHFALKNIRQRLEAMCGGSLTIAPREGGGTLVTVSIPDPPPA